MQFAVQMYAYMRVTWGNYDLTYVTTELMSDVLVLSSSALGLVGHCFTVSDAGIICVVFVFSPSALV